MNGQEACAGVLGASVGVVGTTELVRVHAKSSEHSEYEGDGHQRLYDKDDWLRNARAENAGEELNGC